MNDGGRIIKIIRIVITNRLAIIKPSTLEIVPEGRGRLRFSGW